MLIRFWKGMQQQRCEKTQKVSDYALIKHKKRSVPVKSQSLARTLKLKYSFTPAAAVIQLYPFKNLNDENLIYKLFIPPNVNSYHVWQKWIFCPVLFSSFNSSLSASEIQINFPLNLYPFKREH